MQPEEIKRWLKPKEWKAFHTFCHFADDEKDELYFELVKGFGALAATRELSEQRRVLLKRHQWDGWSADYDGMPLGEPFCLECDNDEPDGHAPDCAWDAALKDVGGE